MSSGAKAGTALYCIGKKTSFELFSYIAQTFIIFFVICAAIINLSLGNSQDKTIWLSLLNVSLGLILPAPNLITKVVKKIGDKPADVGS